MEDKKKVALNCKRHCAIAGWDNLAHVGPHMLPPVYQSTIITRIVVNEITAWAGPCSFISALFWALIMVRNSGSTTPPWGFLGCLCNPWFAGPDDLHQCGASPSKGSCCLLQDFPACSGSSESVACLEGSDLLWMHKVVEWHTSSTRESWISLPIVIAQVCQMLPEIWLMEKILNAFWTLSLGRMEAQIQIYSVGFKEI